MSNIIRKTLLVLSLIIPKLILNAQEFNIPRELFSRAELSGFAETSHDSDVVKFCRSVAKLGAKAHVEVFGRTKEGNDLFVVVLSNPRIKSPEEAKASGKPVIYIQANIHAGEVEGKEASMQLIREICFGSKSGLLDNQILLFCPNFNPDGNDKLSPTNRYSQDSSPALTGVRASGEGLDLNREGIKSEALETKALLENIILKWDPCLFIDLHTDNGSWHGYALNYAPAFLTAGMPPITSYISDTLLPSVTHTLLDRSGIPVFFHGYMNAKEGEQTTYSTYSHLPRYMVNYMGLRNRMAILSETFSHDNFEKRVLSNYLFLVSVLEFTCNHSHDLIRVVNEADSETIKQIEDEAGRIKKGVVYQIAAASKPIDLLTRETESYTDQNGRTRKRATGRIFWIRDVRHFNHFEPTLEATVPFGYVFPAELTEVASKLKQHGIIVKTLEKKTRITGEEFTISKYTREQKKSFGNHNVVSVQGEFKPVKKTAEAGSFFVDMHQPLAWLIFYMLEPQSDDGLLLWNYFDNYLILKGAEKSPVVYPVIKLLKPVGK